MVLPLLLVLGGASRATAQCTTIASSCPASFGTECCDTGGQCCAADGAGGRPDCPPSTPDFCALVCNANRGDCDLDVSNGCEVDLLTNRNHCNSCGNACGFPNGTGACQGGTCVAGTCNANFGNCDSQFNNGCETDLRTSAASCGACGASCSSNHVTPTCTASQCTGACVSGFDDCNNDKRADGCEASLDAVGTCGACTTNCATQVQHANAVACSLARLCDYGTCENGFSDCDGNRSNGCETSGGCVDFSVPPDLASSPDLRTSPDLFMSADLSTSPDLVSSADLATSTDLHVVVDLGVSETMDASIVPSDLAAPFDVASALPDQSGGSPDLMGSDLTPVDLASAKGASKGGCSVAATGSSDGVFLGLLFVLALATRRRHDSDRIRRRSGA